MPMQIFSWWRVRVPQRYIAIIATAVGLLLILLKSNFKIIPFLILKSNRIQDYLAKQYNLCKIGFNAIENLESEERIRHIGCTILKPSVNTNVPIKLEFARDQDAVFGWYQGMQIRFFEDIVKSGYLLDEVVVFFMISDDGTLLDSAKSILKNLGYFYLAHNHFTSSPEIIPLHTIYQPDFHFIQHKGFDGYITG